MGRRKKKSTANGKNKKRSGINIDLAVLVMFVVTILSFVVIYGENGVIGEILSPALGGIIGAIKYVIPIGFLVLTVCIAKNDRNYITSKFIQYGILLACIAATLSIYQFSNGYISDNLEFSQIIEAAYDLGVQNNGGGTVGVVIAYPLIKLLGFFGAAVTTMGIVAVLFVFTFGLHPSTIMLDIMDEMNARREEREEELLASREQRMARRESMRTAPPQQAPLTEEQRRDKRRKDNIADIQTSIDEDEITINLNGQRQGGGVEEEKSKSGFFGKFKKDLSPENDPDVIKANKDGFGSKIGSITNRITAITSLMANYEPGSVEYETLRYRTQCGQALQQEEIDKAKGILPNPMPKTWYISSENIIKIDDSDDIIAKKTLNQALCASKKPYFFGYNYTTLKQEYDTFVRDTNEHIQSIIGKNVRELLKNDGNLPENEQKILDFYKRKLPLDVSPSTMNRICWAIEDEFDGVDSFENVDFDYQIYKSGVEYAQEDYELIKIKCEAYKQKKREINKKKFVEHDGVEESVADQIAKLNSDLEETCFSICSNEQVLCEILLDICYSDGMDVNIVWNLCGDIIVDKLINKTGAYNYPEQDANGEFSYGGTKFTIKTVKAGGEMND